MAAKRGQIVGTVLLSGGGVSSGATVQVNVHGGAAATLYTTETGGTTTTNPLTTDSGGFYSCWVPEGDYDLAFSGTGVTGRTVTVSVLQAANEPGPLSTATGDLTYASSANALGRLSVGSATQVLHGGTTPAYAGVAVADLTATGTPGATTFLRGDNTWSVPGFPGTKVRIEFFCPAIAGTPSGVTVTLVLLRDAAIIGRAQLQGGTTGVGLGSCTVVTYDTPSVAAHVYKASVFVSSSSITIVAGAGGSGNFLPAHLRVTKA